MMCPLWHSNDLSQALGLAAIAEAPPVTGVSIDTRSLQPGDLFVALQGERDGHDFVRQAFDKGAAGAVIRQDRAAAFGDLHPLYPVPDVLQGLERLGLAARARSRARILAITGSVGKTGSKEALRLALERQGRTHASAASYNNHFGVPLTLARMPEKAQFGLFEIGMNHAGEIAPLTRMVRPHAALVTIVEAVHREHFRSCAGIADAKGEIFGGLEPGGTAILNRDNPWFERLKAHALASSAGRIIGFGENEKADIRALAIFSDAEGSTVKAEIFGRPLSFRLGIAGRHHAVNALSWLAAIDALHADVEAAAASFEDLRPPRGRGEQIVLALPGGEALLVDESYNANPASMQAAFGTLSRFAGRRVAVLGDMLELGPEAQTLHRALANPLETGAIDAVFACGPLMKNLWDALPLARRGGYADTAAALAPLVIDALRPGDCIMVKGSNGSRTFAIVEALKARFGSSAESPVGK